MTCGWPGNISSIRSRAALTTIDASTKPHFPGESIDNISDRSLVARCANRLVAAADQESC
jgi:hypothetical protein